MLLGSNVYSAPKGPAHIDHMFADKMKNASLPYSNTKGTLKAWPLSLDPGEQVTVRLMKYSESLPAPFSGQHRIYLRGNKVALYWNNKPVVLSPITGPSISYSFNISQAVGQMRMVVTGTNGLPPIIMAEEDAQSGTYGSQQFLRNLKENPLPRWMVATGTNFVGKRQVTYTTTGDHLNPHYLTLNDAIKLSIEANREYIWLCLPADITDDEFTDLLPLLSTFKKVYLEFTNELWHDSFRFQNQDYLADLAENQGWTGFPRAYLAYGMAAKRIVELDALNTTANCVLGLGTNGGFGRHAEIVLRADAWIANDPNSSLNDFHIALDFISPAIYISSFAAEKKYGKITNREDLLSWSEEALTTRLGSVQRHINEAKKYGVGVCVYEWGLGWVPDKNDQSQVDLMWAWRDDLRVSSMYSKILAFAKDQGIEAMCHFNDRSTFLDRRYGPWGLVHSPFDSVYSSNKGSVIKAWMRTFPHDPTPTPTPVPTPVPTPPPYAPVRLAYLELKLAQDKFDKLYRASLDASIG